MSDDQWGPGEPTAWKSHGSVHLGDREVELIYGEHPHSRQDNRHYAMLDETPTAFDGHRIQVGVIIEESNYLKSSHYSGDEVRKGGGCKITADGQVVFAFFSRSAMASCLRAHQLIGQLMEHSSNWMDAKARAELLGRKVFYREHPAIIERLIVDQGCLILKTADGAAFPTPVWRDEDDEESEPTVKVEVTDPMIWWFRS